MKLNSKILTIFLLILLIFSSACFATDSNNDIMLISESTSSQQESDIRDSDLYVSDENTTDIKNTINGNVFASVDTLNIDPTNNGGIIEGNLFATANNVNIKSNVTYSDTEKDDLGNPAISIDKACTISGNAFITANKFVLEPGSKIYGDLYICANEIELSQGSIIYGNVFLVSNKLTLNAEIGGSLYATVKSFDMQYFGFISRDLHLSAENANLNGYVYRNSFIEAKDISTDDKFINQKDFNVTDANSLTFSGEVKGNATVNVKSITLKNKADDKDLTCKISGNLSYSSKHEIEIPEGVVAKEISYSNYTNTSSKTLLSSIWDYVLSLLTLLICVYVIYLLISKFATKYLDKISNISGLNLLKYLGIGIGFLILVPIITVLLFITNIGSAVGSLLLLVYIILLLISKPIFIISIAIFAKNKLSDKINIYLYILAVSIILSLISLVPYLGFIVSALVSATGFGMIIKNLIPSKNK